MLKRFFIRLNRFIKRLDWYFSPLKVLPEKTPRQVVSYVTSLNYSDLMDLKDIFDKLGVVTNAGVPDPISLLTCRLVNREIKKINL